MDGELRPLVAGAPAERLAIDELAEAVEERRFRRLDRDFRQSVRQAEVGEHPGGVGEDVDADAHGLDLWRGLKDSAWNRALMQLERQREPPDSAADDEHVIHQEKSGSDPDLLADPSPRVAE